MIKYSAFGFVLLAVAACDKPNEEQAKIDKARQDRAQTITAATVEAEKKIDKADDKANRQIGEATESIVRMKADFTSARQQDLATIDKKLAELDAKALHATGTAKANADVSLATAHKKRDALAADLANVNTSTTTTWDATKTRIEDGFTDLKRSVDAVKL
ncbi:MAG: hypothetical protein JWM74_4775 [Myxococcaceae bacterium]|nr:hypothetical protein [Myxococcaceae bacterium]